MREISLLVICEIKGVFVKTFTGDDNYPLRNCENLLLPIKMQLSKKWKTFSQLFVPFLAFTSNLKHFEKKIILIGNEFPKVPTVKDLGRRLSKKQYFRTPFNSRHAKGSQMLMKSAWEYFYQNFLSLWGKLISKMFLLMICEMAGAFFSTLTADEKCSLGRCENCGPNSNAII